MNYVSILKNPVYRSQDLEPLDSHQFCHWLPITSRESCTPGAGTLLLTAPLCAPPHFLALLKLTSAHILWEGVMCVASGLKHLRAEAYPTHCLLPIMSALVFVHWGGRATRKKLLEVLSPLMEAKSPTESPCLPWTLHKVSIEPLGCGLVLRGGNLVQYCGLEKCPIIPPTGVLSDMVGVFSTRKWQQVLWSSGFPNPTMSAQLAVAKYAAPPAASASWPEWQHGIMSGQHQRILSSYILKECGRDNKKLSSANGLVLMDVL